MVMEGGQSSRSPQQISDVFQKFALAFKTKTYELFNEESAATDTYVDADLLLDSPEELIPDQKVVVIKPDPAPGSHDSDAQLVQSLIPSLFATLSSFEASYIQFQAAHVPEVDQNALEAADKSIVSVMHKLTGMKKLYKDSRKWKGVEFPAASFLEFQVQENQSKLRALDTIVNSLQSQIDIIEDEMIVLRKKLDKIRISNSALSRKLGLKEEKMDLVMGFLLTIRVFEAMLNDFVKSLRWFTKILIELMTKAGWDLEEASEFVYSGVSYSKKGHFRYAFLSYVCLGMFQNFDKYDFGLSHSGIACNGNGIRHCENGSFDNDNNGYLRQLIEHVACNPMEILGKNPKCEFFRFCERKYDELINPRMESSIFSSVLGRKEKVLDSWKSMAVFYESFVRMESSLWLLHKLAYSFCPAVEIFQVERGVEFSMVYMKDVLGKCSLLGGEARPRVGFTVVPGFKVGRTVIQSQVYRTNSTYNE